MNLVIDIGNTIAKIAVFRDGSIVEIFYDSNQTLEQLPDICAKYPIDKAIVATVIDLGERVLAQLAHLPVPLLWLTKKHRFRWRTFTRRPKHLGTTAWRLLWEPMNNFPEKIFWW